MRIITGFLREVKGKYEKLFLRTKKKFRVFRTIGAERPEPYDSRELSSRRIRSRSSMTSVRFRAEP